MLVKNNSAIPIVNVAQNTGEIDWELIKIKVFNDNDDIEANGYLAIPGNNKMGNFTVDNENKIKKDSQLGDALDKAVII